MSDTNYDTVHARTLHLFPELVTSLGGDPAALLAHAGIGDGGRLGATYRKMVLLLEHAALTLDCPDFAMRLGQMQGGGFYGPLGTAMRHSRSFGDAIDYSCSHTYAHSRAVRIKRDKAAEDGSVFVCHDILVDGIAGHGQLMEQMLLVGHLTAMEITGGHARARTIHFRHQPISTLAVYRRYFGCEILFGQKQDGCTFSAASLASPIVDPDANAYRAVTTYIDRSFTEHAPPLHAQVRGLVMRFLGTDQCTNDRIAAELNLHPRTLHRRLRAENSSFQQVKDEVRRELMTYYLCQTGLDFAHISERLGFAEQSVFTRNCNRWLAASPTQVRAKARLPA